MPAGRPTKYNPECCDSVVEWMKKGASLHTVALKLDICYETLREWRKGGDKPEFSAAIKRGLSFSRGFWEEQGQKGIWGGKEFSPSTWFMNMKNRFGNDNDGEFYWADKQEHDVSIHDDSALYEDEEGNLVEL